MPIFIADGSNMLEVWQATGDAVHSVRRTATPAALIFSNVPRRFGHAATDRQAAYVRSWSQ